MNTRAKHYVIAVVIGAIACAMALYAYEPAIPGEGLVPLVILGSLALVAEALTVVMPNSVIGSIGFIPFLALAVIVPNWIALAAAVLIRIIVEVMSRRAAAKVTFNVCQHAITFAIAVIV